MLFMVAILPFNSLSLLAKSVCLSMGVFLLAALDINLSQIFFLGYRIFS